MTLIPTGPSVLLTAVLCLLPNLAAAETWTVTEGQQGERHGVWVIQRGKDAPQSGISGKGTITGPSGSDTFLFSGSTKWFMANRVGGGLCKYTVTANARLALSGHVDCHTGPASPWSATITDTAEDRPVVFTPSPGDQRQTAEYRQLTGAQRTAVEAEVGQFRSELDLNTAWSKNFDVDCRVNDYLMVRLQRPRWSTQRARDALGYQCIDPDKIRRYELAQCLQTHTAARQAASCDCIASRFSEAFARQPGSSSDHEVALLVDAGKLCRQH